MERSLIRKSSYSRFEPVHAVLLPVGFAPDREDGEAVPPVRVVDEPLRGLAGRGLAAADVLAVRVHDQEAELLLLHAGGAEGLHEVGLPHAGRREDAHVLREDAGRDPDGDIPDHVLAAPHEADLDLAHLLGEEAEVPGRGIFDRGELGGDGAGLVELPVLIDKPEGDSIDRDEDVLAEAVELLGIGPGVPSGVGEVAVMREVGDLGKEGCALGGVDNLFDVPDIERLAVGGDEAVGEDAPADEPVLRCVGGFSIAQIHHGNLRTGSHRSADRCLLQRAARAGRPSPAPRSLRSGRPCGGRRRGGTGSPGCGRLRSSRRAGP